MTKVRTKNKIKSTSSSSMKCGNDYVYGAGMKLKFDEPSNILYQISQAYIRKNDLYPVYYTAENIKELQYNYTDNFKRFEVFAFLSSIRRTDNNIGLFHTTINNSFHNAQAIENIGDAFCNIKRTYAALKRFENILYWKLSQNSDNDLDFCMNKLSNFHERSLIKINQNRTIYTFRLSDLMKHFNENLLQTTNFFHEPRQPKNPFNNIAFEPHHLYNIYFAVKCSDYTIPTLVFLWVRSQFNLLKFEVNFYSNIRDDYILNEFNSMGTSHKLKAIRAFLRVHEFLCKFDIDDQFPDDILSKAFGHIFLDYMYARHSMCDRRRYYCKTLYRKKLFNFHKYNASFGRKKYIRQKPIFNHVKANEKYMYSQDFNIKYPSEREIEMLCERDQYDYLDEDVFDGSSSDDNNYFTDDDDDDDDSEIEIIISRNNTNQLERLETTVIPQQDNHSDQQNNVTALQNEESRENQENEENAYDSDDEAASMSTTDTTRQRDDTIASEILHTSELETLYDENMCEENDDDIESETQSVGSYS